MNLQKRYYRLAALFIVVGFFALSFTHAEAAAPKQKVLVIPVYSSDLPVKVTPAIDASDTIAGIRGKLLTNKDSVNNFYKENDLTGTKWRDLDVTVADWVDLGFSIKDSIHSVSDDLVSFIQKAIAVEKAKYPSKYDYYAIILSQQLPCGFGGVACSSAYINGNFDVIRPGRIIINGNQSTQVWAHEFGHAISSALKHYGSYKCGSKDIDIPPNCSGEDYGGGTMGSTGYWDLGAYQKQRAGFITSSMIVDVPPVQAGMPNQSYTYTISPVETGGAHPLGLHITSPSGNVYYVEYRQRVKFDTTLYKAFSGTWIDMLYNGPDLASSIKNQTPEIVNVKRFDATGETTFIDDLGADYNLVITQISSVPNVSDTIKIQYIKRHTIAAHVVNADGSNAGAGLIAFLTDTTDEHAKREILFTGPDGIALFKHANPNDTYKVDVDGGDNKFSPDSVGNIKPINDITDVTLKLKLGTITGHVKKVDGSPAAGDSVNLINKNSSSKNLATITDSNGDFTFTGVEKKFKYSPTQYKLSALTLDANNLASDFVDVTVDALTVKSPDLQLKPPSPHSTLSINVTPSTGLYEIAIFAPIPSTTGVPFYGQGAPTLDLTSPQGKYSVGLPLTSDTYGDPYPVYPLLAGTKYQIGFEWNAAPSHFVSMAEIVLAPGSNVVNIICSDPNPQMTYWNVFNCHSVNSPGGGTPTTPAPSPTPTPPVTPTPPPTTNNLITLSDSSITAGHYANFQLVNSGPGFKTMKINWGDNTLPTTYSVMGTQIAQHTYANAGTYTISVNDVAAMTVTVASPVTPPLSTPAAPAPVPVASPTPVTPTTSAPKTPWSATGSMTGTLQAGKTLSFMVNLTPGEAHPNAITTLYIEDLSNKVINQYTFANQNLIVGTSKQYTFIWKAVAGSYRVKAGISSSDYKTQYYWNNAITSFSVK